MDNSVNLKVSFVPQFSAPSSFRHPGNIVWFPPLGEWHLRGFTCLTMVFNFVDQHSDYFTNMTGNRPSQLANFTVFNNIDVRKLGIWWKNLFKMLKHC